MSKNFNSENPKGNFDAYDPDKLIDGHTVFVGEVSKPAIMATMLRLYDAEVKALQETAQRGGIIDSSKLLFPQGMATPISHFMARMEMRMVDQKGLFDKVREDKNFTQITFGNLLNHRSGLDVGHEVSEENSDSHQKSWAERVGKQEEDKILNKKTDQSFVQMLENQSSSEDEKTR